MQEIWKPVKNYEGIYVVSNTGKVYSINRVDRLGRVKEGKELKQRVSKFGYLYVPLVKDGKRKNKSIHRLVATTFLVGNENDVVNHLDGNKKNNNVNNLEFTTQKENIKHSWKNHLSKPYNAKKVIQYDKNGNLINKFNSIMDAERITGISNSKIVCCCKKQYGRKSAGGFIWRYSNENYS